VRKHETVGAFQKIPMVMPATDILMSAQRKSRNVPPTKGMIHLTICHRTLLWRVKIILFNIWFQRQMFALWSACNVGIANIAKRERNKGAKQLDALMKVSLFVFLLCWPSSFILITERPYVCQELSVPLRTYTENFPKRRDLHPYERSLIELTFGEGYYEQV